MLLGEAEETLTLTEIDPDTYEQIYKVKLHLLYLFDCLFLCTLSFVPDDEAEDANGVRSRRRRHSRVAASPQPAERLSHYILL